MSKDNLCVYGRLRQGISCASAALCAALVVLVPGVMLAQDSWVPPSHEMKTYLAVPLGSGWMFLIEDVDGDGESNLITADSVSATCNNIEIGAIVPGPVCNYRSWGGIAGAADVSGDGCREMFVARWTERGLLLDCHDWRSEDGPSVPIYEIGPLIRRFGRRSAWAAGSVEILGCRDADGDGRREVFIGVRVLHDAPERRSLLVCDALTGDSLWHYEMGPLVTNVDFVEDGNGRSLVVVASYSPSNGVTWNGTSDLRSWVFCLMPDGSLKWRLPVTGPESSCRVLAVDLGRDGRKEVLVLRRLGISDRANPDPSARWSLAVLDAATGEFLQRCFLGDGICDAVSAHIDDDADPEIIAVGENRHLFILDADAGRLHTRSEISDMPHYAIGGVADLDGDTKQEILCLGDERLVVRDSEGNLKAECPGALKQMPAIALVDGKVRVVGQSATTVRLYSLERAGPRKIALRHLPLKAKALLVAIGVGIGAAVLSGVVLVRGYVTKRETARAGSEETLDQLLTTMAAFSHGGVSLKIIDRVRFYLKNWERMAGQGSEGEDPLAKLVSSFSESIIPDLKRIVFLSRRAGTPSEHWRDMLAHSSRGLRVLQSLGASGAEADSGGRGPAAASALAELDAVDRNLAAIREYLRSRFITHVLAAISAGVSRRREDLGKANIAVTLRQVGATGDAAFLSSASFEKIFDNLLMNAIRAMEGKNEGKLEVTLEAEGAYLRIDVSDTGCGIAKENWERIFDRDFTTKPGGGFGLYYARQEVAKFAGKVFIHDSVMGTGSVVRMILRGSEGAGA